ncbi:MAG: hypothetical protein L6Q35_10625 [Phycisphaerales bacterium]|nr:hypothetical protein [Phycisphaerales bacterium]
MKKPVFLGAAALVIPACAALAQPRNHEPYNLLVCNHTMRSVAMVNSVIGYVMDDTYIALANYGLSGVPGDAVNVWRQIWVTDTAGGRLHRFSADLSIPPIYYGEALLGAVDQLRGMEYVPGNYTVYLGHSGTAGGAPGDGVFMLDVAGQITGWFPATNPMDIMWSPERGELLISNATDDSIDRYTLEGVFLGRLVDSDGISGIDSPRQMSRNHHSGEVIACGADAPAGLYYYDIDGEELAFYPQAGRPAGVIELDNDLKHGLLLFTTENGLFTYWTDNDQLTTVRSNESWGFANTVQFFCWADYDRSDFVDTDDFTAFVVDFEKGVPQADFDGTGFVDLDDYVYFLQRFIEGC